MELIDSLTLHIGQLADQQHLILDSLRLNRAGKYSKLLIVVDPAIDQTRLAEIMETPADTVVEASEAAVTGVSSDQIADLTRLISAYLDDADPIPGHYTLEVSSGGIGRQLTEDRHFALALGRTLNVVTSADGDITAELLGFDAGSLYLTHDGQARSIERADIVKAQEVPTF